MVNRKQIIEIVDAIMSNRFVVKGSKKCPDTPAVTANPAIIINQTIVAALALFLESTLFANKVSKAVPEALTPSPIARNPKNAKKIPNFGEEYINTVENVDSIPPMHKMAIPTIIQGVHFPDLSAPKPILGLII